MAANAFTPYQKRLFLFLSVATFFEGFDFMALTQILPNLRADLGLEERWWSGVIIGTVNAGTIAAFWLVRGADRIGRRRTLTITIAGYTLFTFATGFSGDVYTFMVLQFFARLFLIGEWAISMVIAAEEFPAARRGFVLGVIQACSSLGAVLCAAIVPVLLRNDVGWRMVYFVGVAPLVILAFARRSLRETERFSAVEKRKTKRSLLHLWSTPYRKPMLILAATWLVAYIPANNAIAFWKDFAIHERAMTDADVGLAITIAAVISMPCVFLYGRVLDRLGRKTGAAIVFSLGGLGIAGCYLLEGRWTITGCLALGIFAASAYSPVLNAYTTELFPTELRGDAYAWANNIFGRIGYVFSPFVLGIAAESVGAFGPVVACTALFNVAAMFMVFAFLPETKGLELEKSSQLG